MRVILKGLDKKLIDIKQRPDTKHDLLFRNKPQTMKGKVKMKIPKDWD